MKTLVRGRGGFNPYQDLPTIVAVDWDGVIYSSEGELSEDALEALRRLSSIGIIFIIWTCREASTISDSVDLMRSMGINIYGVNINHIQNVKAYEFESRKIFAHKYIDDQGVGWSYVRWNDIVNELISYQTCRIARGEITMKGYVREMRTEVSNAKKVLRDFGIKVTKEQEQEWLTWTPIRLENHMRSLILSKLDEK